MTGRNGVNWDINTTFIMYSTARDNYRLLHLADTAYSLTTGFFSFLSLACRVGEQRRSSEPDVGPDVEAPGNQAAASPTSKSVYYVL
jgi:hypothetical protein